MNKTTPEVSIHHLLGLGFHKHSYKTIGNMIYFDLDRGRQLTISSVGTPNEMVSICQQNPGSSIREMSDVIVLHNWDYDGYMTLDWIITLINALNPKI